MMISYPDPRELAVSRLCWYDPRNPNYIPETLEADELPAPFGHKSCYCDNCFQGRNQLAVVILSLLEDGNKS